MLSKKRAAPRYVVAFVTERCPAQCGHCLLGDERYEGREMSPADYERTARSMKPFYFLLLTGGEPFLRMDLPEIAAVFIRNCSVANVGIPTNGFYPEKTEKAVSAMAGAFPGVQFGVDVSLDAVGDAHDVLRGTPGIFESALETYRRLRTLAERFKNLNVNIAVTLSRNNLGEADELVDYLFRVLGATNVNLLLVRGKPRDPASIGVPPEDYRRIALRIDRGMTDRDGGYRGYAETTAINAMRRVRSRIIYDTIRTGTYQTPCYAGRLGAVIRANGDVTACELRDGVFGNLSEENYDFGKIWNSPAAVRERAEIRGVRCFCTYECFYTLNVLYNRRFLPELFGEYLRESGLKLSRSTLGPKRTSGK